MCVLSLLSACSSSSIFWGKQIFCFQTVAFSLLVTVSTSAYSAHYLTRWWLPSSSSSSSLLLCYAFSLLCIGSRLWTELSVDSQLSPWPLLCLIFCSSTCRIDTVHAHRNLQEFWRRILKRVPRKKKINTPSCWKVRKASHNWWHNKVSLNYLLYILI